MYGQADLFSVLSRLPNEVKKALEIQKVKRLIGLGVVVLL